MKKTAYIFFFLLVSLMFSACTDSAAGGIRRFFKTGSQGKSDHSSNPDVYTSPNEQLELDDYLGWIKDEDNGLKVEKKINEVIFSVQYKPDEFEAVLNLHKSNPLKKEILTKVKEIEGLQYFTFSIAVPENKGDILKYNLHDEQEYYARVEYYSFNVQNDMVLIDGNDTLPCVMCHFERTYSVAPVIKFVLAFPESEKGRSRGQYYAKTISFDDKVFSTGKVNLEITQQAISAIPQLKFN